MTVRSAVRWAATHGAMRLAIRARARAGNPDAEVLRDPAVREDPFAHYERLRTAAPFAGGAFARVSVHHDVCTDVLRSDDFGQIGGNRTEGMPPLLRTALRLAGPRRSTGPIDPPSMLAVDPPEHTRYRRLVSRAFSARAVARLRERTRQIADELLDGLEREAAADGGHADLVARYASLLPVTVISEVLGVPVAMRERFLAWGDGASPSLDMGVDWRTHRSVERNLGELDTWFRGHVQRLRRSPGEDLLSALVATADDDGSGLTEQELLSTALLVFGAGFETTVNLVGNGAAQLFAHPDQRRLLAEDPSLWPNAVDEVLRVDSPVQRTGRRVRRDTTVHGVPLREGDLVLLVLAAANRDPRVFRDPHVFDVTRANAREHVAFSSGIHFCLGAALARMEGEVALRALFERFPDLAAAGAGRRRRTVVLRGYESLPVVLPPQTAAVG
ncbi:cytochrome P450 [Geodermatophilus bullaregiensis]|uniref:cytochrome P450 n=1 Tax=Geodermatophilus bullaregiensis TaxID=1564160 RepID=UPI0027DAE0A1|nr:cytochrome P450 [Geodermatophilus bullaregiensis]MBM7808969.1 cytochrome P450 [Geodermatophilus bullaregiensis]